MSFTCDQCRQRQSLRQPHVTITGRKLCDTCFNRMEGAITGAAIAIDEGHPDDAVESGLIMSRVFEFVRRRRRKR